MNNNPNIKILIATHKNYRMPQDDIYLPIHVGAEGKVPLDIRNLASDNIGDNISERNPNWCELTGLYWAWKNLPCDYLGLAHYRRHWARGKSARGKLSNIVSSNNRKWRAIATCADIEKLLSEHDILLPTPRNYVIESNYSQYAHAHHAVDLDTTRQIIAEKCPEYLPAFDESMKQTVGHRFNMFIMRRDLADEYCEWLFDILFELERRLDISGYSTNDARVFGFVSERLLDVWLTTRGYQYAEVPYIFMESENWFKKGGAFLKRKFTR